ncbi:MAG: hypothetical protein BM485_06430 [Desulfobulbaceae bacterium DB1]|nr:MAG: hypothetical protein BM485_06430 [Desulfobulbaceae bacterium DB1]
MSRPIAVSFFVASGVYLILSCSTYFTGAALDNGVNPRVVAVRLALLFLLPGLAWTVYNRYDSARSR